MSLFKSFCLALVVISLFIVVFYIAQALLILLIALSIIAVGKVITYSLLIIFVIAIVTKEIYDMGNTNE